MLVQSNTMANAQSITAPDLWSRAIVRRALKAALATFHHETGNPYASLVTIATLPGGAPLMLISTLAEHTKNIAQNPHVSLLFDETGGLDDPLEGARVSVSGRVEKLDNPCARARFLSRHPSAASYADFGDFSFYALKIEGAHFVGGFGLITDLTPEDLTIDVSDAARLIEAEAEIVEHMNGDHAGTVALYATKLLGAGAGDWRFAACDPEGCDLVLGEKGVRLDFPQRVTTPQDVRKTLAELAKTARS